MWSGRKDTEKGILGICKIEHAKEGRMPVIESLVYLGDSKLRNVQLT